MTPLRTEAPAKINLSLGVVGRREDGYHLLTTRMALLELADRLLLMPGCSGLRVEAMPGDEIPLAPDRNLAWRGLMAGFAGSDHAGLACLTLEKRIPSAAGLGGGSSDAAAAWHLARRWWGEVQAAKREEIEGLAAIGADVPFFAARVAVARVEGVGERVTEVNRPVREREVVLAHPPFSLSTAAVFAELRPGEWRREGGEPQDGENDLLAPARRLRPELDDVLRLVAAAGGRPQLTGSGPTVFCRTDDPQRAAAIAARLARAGLRATHTRMRTEPATIEAVEDEAEVN